MSPRPEKRRAPKIVVTGERPARPKRRPWWAPTPKWWTLLVTGWAGIAAQWIVSGEFGTTERGMCALLLGTLASTWAKSNKPKRSSWGRQKP
jgi:hypothetical protein